MASEDDAGYELFIASHDENGNLQMNAIREISEEERAEINDARKSMLAFRREVSVFETMQRNLESIRKYHSWVFGSTAGKENIDGRQFPQIAYEMNRRVLNYVASCRLYLDYMDHRLSEDPEGRKLFREATNEAYDTSPEYRLMDQVRNYVQHRGLPVGHMDYSAGIIGDGIKIEGDIYFDRDELLVDTKLKAIVREDLKSGDKHISILEVVNRYDSWMHGIHVCALAALVGKHMGAYKRLEKLYVEVGAPKGVAPMVAKLRKNDDGTMGFTSDNLPTEALAQFQQAIRLLEGDDGGS